jgi:hypothetical protein
MMESWGGTPWIFSHFLVAKEENFFAALASLIATRFPGEKVKEDGV